MRVQCAGTASHRTQIGQRGPGTRLGNVRGRSSRHSLSKPPGLTASALTDGRVGTNRVGSRCAGSDAGNDARIDPGGPAPAKYETYSALSVDSAGQRSRAGDPRCDAEGGVPREAVSSNTTAHRRGGPDQPRLRAINVSIGVRSLNCRGLAGAGIVN